MLLQICGQSNIQLIEAAKEAGVDRFAFVSAHDYGFPGGVLWHLYEVKSKYPYLTVPSHRMQQYRRRVEAATRLVVAQAALHRFLWSSADTC